MNCRERVRAALAGQEADRRPIVGWSSDDDAQVVETYDPALKDRIQLVEILDPVGRARDEGQDLVRLFEDDLDAGSAALERFAAETLQAAELALGQGADGILYRLSGARPSVASPMAYGGHFLEVDRSILTSLQGRGLRFLFVEGEDAYLDVVSDLPAECFGWEGPDGVGDMRAVRTGPVFAADPSAELGSNLRVPIHA